MTGGGPGSHPNRRSGDLVTVASGPAWADPEVKMLTITWGGAPAAPCPPRERRKEARSDVARATAEQPSLDEHPRAERPPEIASFQLEEPGLLVSEIMTPRIHSVDEATPVADAARMMREAHIHRVLVTGRGRVVGIVTTSDLLGLLTGEA